jgi:hypothetical protein
VDTQDTFGTVTASLIWPVTFRQHIFFFPQALKAKIHDAKATGRSGQQEGGSIGGKQHINVVEMDNMKSTVSALSDEMAQVQAVMQASRDNEGDSQAEESAASAFGWPGLPPHHKKKKHGWEKINDNLLKYNT